MARKRQDTDSLVKGAIATFTKAADDLETAVKQYDTTASSKRALANTLLAEASRAEVEADKAQEIATRIRGLVSA